jgi:conjugative relaxase-like TrwC/TraI family protein
MLTLVKRCNASNFKDYFAGDFESPMWAGLDREVGANLGPTRSLLSAVAPVPNWSELKPEPFEDGVERLSAAAVDRGVLSYELTFSAPKSVSVAALAGPVPDARILRTHLAAVDDALGFLAGYLFARKMEAGKVSLLAREAVVARFTHPWNFTTEPQLHTHANLSRTLDSDQGALFGYPFFLHQRAVRAAYHYSLASRLRQLGFGIRVGQYGSLAWELEGIPTQVLKRFAERSSAIRSLAAQSGGGYFSQAVESRLATLMSRRLLPKTDPGMSLASARCQWANTVARRNCLPIVGTASAAGEFEMPRLDEIFRRGSLQTKAIFEGALLSCWLGSPRPFTEARREALRFLQRLVDDGEIFEDPRGGSVCYPKVFDVEQRILGCIAGGYSKGKALNWKWPMRGKSAWVGKVLDPVAERPDRTRIACLFGDSMPAGAKLVDGKGIELKEALVTMKKWSAFEVCELLDGRGVQETLLVVEEGFHKGDFLQRLSRLLPPKALNFSGGRKLSLPSKTVEVKQGSVESLVDGSSSLIRSLREVADRVRQFGKRGPRKVPRASVIFAPWAKRQELAALNQHLLGSGNLQEGMRGVRKVQMCEVVPWSDFLAQERRAGYGLFFPRNLESALPKSLSGLLPAKCAGFRHGSTWWFMGPRADGKIQLRAKKRSKLILPEELNWIRRVALVVSTRELEMAARQPMQSLAKYTEGKNTIHEGEVVVIQKIRRDGSLVLEDGRVFSDRFRLLAPVVLLREFVKNQRPLESAIIGEEMLERGVEDLLALPCRKITVMARAPKEMLRRLDESNRARLVQQYEKRAMRFLFHDDQDEEESTDLLLPRRRWVKILEKARARPVTIAQALEIVSGPAHPPVPQIDQNNRNGKEQDRLAESRDGLERSSDEVRNFGTSPGTDAPLQERTTPDAITGTQPLESAPHSTDTNRPAIERKESDPFNPLVAGDDLEPPMTSYKVQNGEDDVQPSPTPAVSVPPTTDSPPQPVSGKKLLPKRKTETKQDASKEDMPAPGED